MMVRVLKFNTASTAEKNAHVKINKEEKRTRWKWKVSNFKDTMKFGENNVKQASYFHTRHTVFYCSVVYIHITIYNIYRNNLFGISGKTLKLSSNNPFHRKFKSTLSLLYHYFYNTISTIATAAAASSLVLCLLCNKKQ